jgi:threonine dehydratase
MSAELPISLADIQAAARRIAGQAVETPLLESQQLARMTGGRVFIKPEMLQRTGSFKFRGAFNRLSQLSPHERRRGVVAFSSGNHGQAIAAAAAVLGIAAVVVMRSDAPSVKIERTRAFGAQIVLFDRCRDDRAAIAQKLADERGLVLVPPYDDYDVMAGQGTVGLEIAGQALQRNAKPDFVLVPCSGCGLLARGSRWRSRRYAWTPRSSPSNRRTMTTPPARSRRDNPSIIRRRRPRLAIPCSRRGRGR